MKQNKKPLKHRNSDIRDSEKNYLNLRILCFKIMHERTVFLVTFFFKTPLLCKEAPTWCSNCGVWALRSEPPSYVQLEPRGHRHPMILGPQILYHEGGF